jgi:hypothetical protein
MCVFSIHDSQRLQNEVCDDKNFDRRQRNFIVRDKRKQVCLPKCVRVCILFRAKYRVALANNAAMDSDEDTRMIDSEQFVASSLEKGKGKAIDNIGANYDDDNLPWYSSLLMFLSTPKMFRFLGFFQG